MIEMYNAVIWGDDGRRRRILMAVAIKDRGMYGTVIACYPPLIPVPFATIEVIERTFPTCVLTVERRADAVQAFEADNAILGSWRKTFNAGEQLF
jgi:hypothetical protein